MGPKLEAVIRLLGDETTSALESKVKLLEKTETALSVSEVLVDLVGAAGQVCSQSVIIHKKTLTVIWS